MMGLDSTARKQTLDRIGVRLAEAQQGPDRGLRSEEDLKAYSRSVITDEIQSLRVDALQSGNRWEPTAEELLAHSLYDRLWGLGPVEALLRDPEVANIHINGYDDAWVVYRDGTKERVDPVADSDDDLVELVSSAGRRFGRSEKRWDPVEWELNLQLPGGQRLHGVRGLTGRPVLTIRCHDFSINRIGHLVDRGVIGDELAGFLSAAVKARLNLIVAGGTNTGKTTMLRCLINEIPPEERVITIEDSLELGLNRFRDLHPDQVSWERRGANIEGKGEATLAECVRATLRQNPDRVIVGEIRGIEVLDMLRAMSQGNDGSMSSIHSDSSQGALVRLSMYMAEAGLNETTANRWISNAIHLIVHTGWVDGVRRVTSVREVTGADGQVISTNEVFRSNRPSYARPAPGAIRTATLDRLIDSGFDPALLNGTRAGAGAG